MGTKYITVALNLLNAKGIVFIQFVYPICLLSFKEMSDTLNFFNYFRTILDDTEHGYFFLNFIFCARSAIMGIILFHR